MNVNRHKQIDMEYKITPDKVSEILRQCNLCTDVITIVYPNESCNWFMKTEDQLCKWYKEMEDNVKRSGGYMIDEWQYVDANQQVMDLRGHVKLKLED